MWKVSQKKTHSKAFRLWIRLHYSPLFFNCNTSLFPANRIRGYQYFRHLIPSIKLCCPLDFYLFSGALFSSYIYLLNFSSKNDCLWKFFLQLVIFLKSYWLLPFDFFCSRLFPSVIIRFSFPVSSLLLFTSLSRLLLLYRFSSNFFVLDLLLTIFFWFGCALHPFLIL